MNRLTSDHDRRATMNRRALVGVPVRTFFSPGRPRLLTTAVSAANLLGRQAELTGLTSLLHGPGGDAIVVCSVRRSGKTALLARPVNGLLFV